MPKGEQRKDIAERLKRLPQGAGIEWTSMRSFRLGGYEFHLPEFLGEFNDNAKAEDNSAENIFSLDKTPDIIQRYLTLFREVSPKNVVELGVFRGGSVALLQLLAKPERLLALELAADRQELLDQFIATEGLQNQIRVEYGVDQADSATVTRLTREFIGEARLYCRAGISAQGDSRPTMAKNCARCRRCATGRTTEFTIAGR